MLTINGHSVGLVSVFPEQTIPGFHLIILLTSDSQKRFQNSTFTTLECLGGADAKRSCSYENVLSLNIFCGSCASFISSFDSHCPKNTAMGQRHFFQ